ncbi:UNVERIFIED_CONTAM: hypothetical protein GTU68_013504 [Idotea baltica]|nr:hypothetical protein [Idotea baltica]
MFDTLKLATENNVVIGAHPGFPDKEAFGRRLLPMRAADVECLVAAQVGSLIGVAGLADANVQYVKAHGALANWAAATPDIALAIAKAVKKSAPGCALLAISGTELESAGTQLGLKTYSEVFADRAYQSNGQLVPRSVEGSVIHDAKAAGDRLIEFLRTGDMPTIDGGSVKLKAESICIHGDNPAAVAMAKNLREQLQSEGFTISSFVA